MKKLVKVWKDSVNWNRMNGEQKRLAVKFGASAALMFAFCWSWLVIPFMLLTAYYLPQVKRFLIMVEE